MSASGFINQNQGGASLLASVEVPSNLRVWGGGDSGNTDAIELVNALDSQPYTQKNNLRVLGGGAVKIDSSVKDPAGQFPTSTMILHCESQVTDAGGPQTGQILQSAGIFENLLDVNGSRNQMVIKGLYDPSEAYPGLVLQVAPDPWRSDTTYNTGDIVFYLTLTYQSVANDNQGHVPLDDSAFWAVSSPAGVSTGGYAQVRGNLTVTGDLVVNGAYPPAPPPPATDNNIILQFTAHRATYADQTPCYLGIDFLSPNTFVSNLGWDDYVQTLPAVSPAPSVPTGLPSPLLPGPYLLSIVATNLAALDQVQQSMVCSLYWDGTRLFGGGFGCVNASGESGTIQVYCNGNVIVNPIGPTPPTFNLSSFAYVNDVTNTGGVDFTFTLAKVNVF